MTTRYRAEQVGSLLRPPELLQARAAHAAGQLPADELRAAEDRAVLDVLRLQRKGGPGYLLGRRATPGRLDERSRRGHRGVRPRARADAVAGTRGRRGGQPRSRRRREAPPEASPHRPRDAVPEGA
jgi:hypothetical protein